MQDDPIVSEVRRIRKEIEAECGNDMHKIFEAALKYQIEYKQLQLKQSKLLGGGRVRKRY